MLILVASCQLQVLSRCLLSFFDEPVEQDHPSLLVDIEEHTCDSVLNQAGPHFINPATQRPATRHSNRPAKLHGLDILPDALPILCRKLLQPFPHRLSARLCAIEDRWNPLALVAGIGGCFGL